MRYVLVYALELSDGVALVDTGLNTPEAWQALNDGLRVVGCAITDVRSVLVTHHHPDHYGLAGRIRDVSGAWIAMHAEDAALLRDRSRDPDGYLQSMHRRLVDHGVPEVSIESFAGASARGARDEATEPDRIVEDGETISLPGWSLQAMWTPGHTPGHLCYYAAGTRTLFAGDHVLPKIVSMVAAYPQQRPSPISDFLGALDKLRGLDVEHVLPGHEQPFGTLRERVAALEAHHVARLNEIEAALTVNEDATAWTLSQSLTWSRPWERLHPMRQRTALFETLAYLIMLVEQGRVVSVDARPYRWRAKRGNSNE